MPNKSKVLKMFSQGVVKPPNHVIKGLQYETIMGSLSYGVSTDNSDQDIYGFSIPYKTIIFPHLQGYIMDFGPRPQGFDQWQEHHVKSPCGQIVYDFNIFGIVRFFNLCLNSNPNMVDSLFTPESCIQHITKIGSIIRDKRHLFLSKKMWFTYKGYAYSQFRKIFTKEPDKGKRKEICEKFGYDTKFAYHIVRLITQVEQVLTEGTMDLQASREQLKFIREGGWTKEELSKYLHDKSISLEEVKNNSKIQEKPDQKAIKELLLNCLEEHFGSLENAVLVPNRSVQFAKEIARVVHDYSDVVNS